MKKWITAIAVLASLQLTAGDVGIVSFKRCLEESKIGKEQQNSLEAMRKQMASSIEKMEAEFAEIKRQASDPDFVDSLSPEKEEEFRVNGQRLMAELQQAQQQYYQVMSQAEYKLVADLTSQIMRASQVVAKDKKLSQILRDDACFFYLPDQMDVTGAVLAELDRQHARDMKGE